MKSDDFPPQVLELFGRYIHGQLTRREFLERAARYAAGGFTAAAMLEALTPNYAWAEQVAKDDARVRSEYVEYPSPKGSGRMRGYLARPAADGRHASIVVVHENRGLTPYIEDVARRLAIEDYVALAPDALTPLGGYPGDDERGGQLFAQLDKAKLREDFLAALDYLEARPESNGKLGVVGFCFGGGIVNALAVRRPDLGAAVSFYGVQPSAEETANIKAPLLLHYAGNDQRVNAGWPAWESALKANGVRYTMYMYPGANHAFHNDSTPRYDEQAAKLAWSRTLAFLRANLAS